MVLFLLHQVIGTPAKEVIIGAELFVFYFYILTVLLYIPFVYVRTFSLLGEKGEGVVFSRPLRALRAA